MSNRPITLLLVDDDPIFRLGLSIALGAFPEFQLLGQLETPTAAIAQITTEAPQILILEPNLNCQDPNGWEFCRQIRQQYPSIKILLLSSYQDLIRLSAARKTGVSGYCPKGKTIEDIVEILRQVAADQSCWEGLPPGFLQQSDSSRQKNWLARQCQLGLAEIDSSLRQIEQQLEITQLSVITWLFWTGRRRELRTARWLVKQLVPIEVIIMPDLVEPSSSQPPDAPIPAITSSDLAVTALAPSSVMAITLNNTLSKVATGIVNRSPVPLEIDVLATEKKRELLYVVLQQVREILDKLRFLDLPKTEISQQVSMSLPEVWQDSVLEFFGKYYLADFPGKNQTLNDLIVSEKDLIKAEILDKIPYIEDLFAYFIDNKTLAIDQVDYRPESPEAQQRAEALLDNLVIQTANAVMALILNNFSENEVIKRTLFDQNMLSTREMAKFRNELSWHYRKQKYWQEPLEIFENQYRLLILQKNQIQQTFVYAPRQGELGQLQGIRWIVTFAWETRDAIAPRLQTIASAVGNALVYVLTQIIGRGIGLIGRGIIQGIGNTLQDVRFGKNR